MAEPTLRRSLKSRNIAFIGLGSGIGVGELRRILRHVRGLSSGVFVGIGSALAGAGPAGLLMAYIITGALVWTVMQSIGEMGTLVSPRSFPGSSLCVPISPLVPRRR